MRAPATPGLKFHPGQQKACGRNVLPFFPQAFLLHGINPFSGRSVGRSVGRSGDAPVQATFPYICPEPRWLHGNPGNPGNVCRAFRQRLAQASCRRPRKNGQVVPATPARPDCAKPLRGQIHGRACGQAWARACSRSATMSSTCSTPTERRTMPGVMPASCSCSSVSCR